MDLHQLEVESELEIPPQKKNFYLFIYFSFSTKFRSTKAKVRYKVKVTQALKSYRKHDGQIDQEVQVRQFYKPIIEGTTVPIRRIGWLAFASKGPSVVNCVLRRAAPIIKWNQELALKNDFWGA